MDKKELRLLAEAAAKNIKTETELSEFRQMLTKIAVETALNAELDDHLGFATIVGLRALVGHPKT